jgi:hypothetical protein
MLALLAAVALARARPRAVRDLGRLETLALGWLAGIVIPSALLVRSIDERRLLVASVLLAILGALSWHRAAESRDGPAPHAASSGVAGREVSRALALGAAAVIAVVGVALVFRAGHGTKLWSPPVAALVAAAFVVLGIASDRLRGRLGRRGFVVLTVAALALLPALNAGQFAAWVVHGDDGGRALAASAAVIVVALTLLVTFAPAHAAARGIAMAYGLYAAVTIGAGLVAPTYTLRDASRAIAAAAPADAVVVGALAHTLSLENRTRPVWYTPKRALNNLLNADLARFDVRLVLTLTPPSRFYLEADEYPFALTPVGRFGVYPTPHLGRAPATKIVLTLHRRLGGGETHPSSPPRSAARQSRAAPRLASRAGYRRGERRSARAASHTCSTRAATASHPWSRTTHARPAAPRRARAPASPSRRATADASGAG